MSEADASTETTVKLTSSDGKDFKVPITVAKMSVTLKNMLDDLGDDEDSPIPLPTVPGAILDKVIQYCTQHKDDPPVAEDLQTSPEKKQEQIVGWDKEFVTVDQATLFEMILAANFLDIKPMLDLTCKTVAEMIKGKTPDEIRKHFNIKNDFTKEEEEQVRKENQWCEEA